MLSGHHLSNDPSATGKGKPADRGETGFGNGYPLTDSKAGRDKRSKKTFRWPHPGLQRFQKEVRLHPYRSFYLLKEQERFYRTRRERDVEKGWMCNYSKL